MVGLLAKSGSGFALPAELTQKLTENNTEGAYKNLDLISKNSLNKKGAIHQCYNTAVVFLTKHLLVF